MGRRRTRVIHLRFIDDNIFFSRVCSNELQCLKIILLVFGYILGLKINLDESTLLGINISED